MLVMPFVASTVMVVGLVVALFVHTRAAPNVACVPTGWSLPYPEALPLPLSLPSSVGIGRVPYALPGRRPILRSQESPFIICPFATTPSWQARHMVIWRSSSSWVPYAAASPGRASTKPPPNVIWYPNRGVTSCPNNALLPLRGSLNATALVAALPPPPAAPLCGAWQPAQPRPPFWWAPRMSYPVKPEPCV